MSDEAVYRTAPATPGLLNRLCRQGLGQSSGSKVTEILLNLLVLPVG